MAYNTIGAKFSSIILCVSICPSLLADSEDRKRIEVEKIEQVMHRAAENSKQFAGLKASLAEQDHEELAPLMLTSATRVLKFNEAVRMLMEARAEWHEAEISLFLALDRLQLQVDARSEQEKKQRKFLADALQPTESTAESASEESGAATPCRVHDEVQEKFLETERELECNWDNELHGDWEAAEMEFWID